MSYLKSVPLNLSNWNIFQKKKKNKKSKFGPKNVLFWYFWSRILKNIVIFEINTLKFVKNESLTRTANFVIGSAFSKGPGSAFSEFPAPLYKVSFFLHSSNKKGVLRNFAKFTWKHLSQSLFFFGGCFWDKQRLSRGRYIIKLQILSLRLDVLCGKCSNNLLMKTYCRCFRAIYNAQTKTYHHLLRLNGKTDIHTHSNFNNWNLEMSKKIKSTLYIGLLYGIANLRRKHF